MKKLLYLILLFVGISSFVNAQVIDIIGTGIHGDGGGDLSITDLSTIDSVVVHSTYKHGYDAPAGPVEFTDADDTFIAPFRPVEEKLFGSLILGHYVGYFKENFTDVDPMVSVDVLANNPLAKYAFYAFVYRDIATADRYSVIDTNHVFMWHNGSAKPYEYDLPVTAASGPRDMTVKVVLAEINSNPDRPNRKAVINVDAGGVTTTMTIDDYNMGKFLNIVELPLYGVPGSATNVNVSIYSPDPDAGEEDGDSFIVGGVVVDVDKECGECEGKLTHLDLEYLGADVDSISVKTKKGRDVNDLETFYDVKTGDVLRLVGNDDKGTLGTEVRIFINDETTSTNIHTSCSVDIYINMVFGQFRVDAGISKDGGPICKTVPPGEEECGECEGQITSLDLEYTGPNVDSVNIYKDKVKSDKLFKTFYNVETGDTLRFVGAGGDNKMGAKIRITVNDESTYTEIHTSCSEDIYVGYVYGDYKVTAGASKDGGPLCEEVPPEEGECGECEGQITSLDLEYTGPNVDSVNIYKDKVKSDKLFKTFYNVETGDTLRFVGAGGDNKMGAKIRITVNDESTYTEIHTSCSEDIYVGYVYGDYKVTAGISKDGGPLCEEEPPEGDECGECEGKITYLELEYSGADADSITVHTKKMKPEDIIATFYDVKSGDILMFSGNDDKGTMGTEIRLVVNDESTYTAIHTSCSVDIYVNSVFGDYTVVAGESRNGGALCEDPDKSSQINTNADLSGLLIYPNPVSHSGTIEFVAGNNGQATVEVYNMYGQKTAVLFDSNVQAGSKQSVAFNTESLTKGMYIVIIRNGNEVLKQKISVIK